MILIAVVVKLYEVWRAKSWLQAEGKVLASRVATQVKSRAFEESGDTQFETIPLVEYEFRIGSQTHRGTRITIGEKVPDSEIEETLARYPVGKAVTVFYNPKNPKQCLLERDLPISNKMFAVGTGLLVLIFVGGPLLLYFGYWNGLDWIRPHMANPKHAPFVTAKRK